ncbi:hypothetical protein SAMN05444365_10297 [Micromonospora pattaloongensis]|uniref:Uncharacterized protein n=1 Tax=Micromonospora pattaloongensis TaxID=405436 RepID=A0A1H3JFE4_9ACTN|nr:hypothetical protein [Micromonospora pattaloongensis]SDY38750.1 hypothetical protein SAMN05444365_10297 [Micromonospora pattaloongensis]
MSADPIGAVTRELLVRQLDAWTPAALHRARRATFVPAGADEATVRAALGVFAEFADLLRGRQLAVVLLDPDAPRLATRLGAAQVGVYGVPGTAESLPVALKAASSAGAPVLAYVDARRGPAPTPTALAAVTVGRPGEVLLVLGAAAREEFDPRHALAEAGYPLVADVELVADSEIALVVFATRSGKSLDAFKNAMWAVDEYAGVRYRDPRDPDGHLLDVSLNPHPGPLRRELLARLAAVGPSTVTELRQFTATDTVYRPSDTTRVLTALLETGVITRDPEHGRLGGDVLIRPAPER